MSYDPEKHHRRSIRMKGYDYSQDGLYFITILVKNRKCIFGKIVWAKNFSPIPPGPPAQRTMHKTPSQIMQLNDAGKTADACWLAIPEHFPNVILHEYVIMPNHVHGIIEIMGANEGAKNISPIPPPPPASPQINNAFHSPSKTVGSIVRGYKIGVTKWMHAISNADDVWQRGYYEHIIRDANAFDSITDYIINNPAKWKEDRFF